MTKLILACLVLFSFWAIQGNSQSQVTTETYNIEVKTIASEDEVVVKQIVITTRGEARIELSAGAGKSRTSMQPKSGSESGQASATITFLATITPKSIGNSETHLVQIQTATGKVGGAGHGNSSSRRYNKVEDLLLVTAKSGNYRLGKPLSLGIFEKHPIVLLVK